MKLFKYHYTNTKYLKTGKKKIKQKTFFLCTFYRLHWKIVLYYKQPRQKNNNNKTDPNPKFPQIMVIRVFTQFT